MADDTPDSVEVTALVNVATTAGRVNRHDTVSIPRGEADRLAAGGQVALVNPPEPVEPVEPVKRGRSTGDAAQMVDDAGSSI